MLSACLPINNKTMFTRRRSNNKPHIIFSLRDVITLNCLLFHQLDETKTFILIREQRKSGVEFPLCDLRGLRHIIYICHTVITVIISETRSRKLCEIPSAASTVEECCSGAHGTNINNY